MLLHMSPLYESFNFPLQVELVSPALAFFTTVPPGKPPLFQIYVNAHTEHRTHPTNTGTKSSHPVLKNKSKKLNIVILSFIYLHYYFHGKIL